MSSPARLAKPVEGRGSTLILDALDSLPLAVFDGSAGNDTGSVALFEQQIDAGDRWLVSNGDWKLNVDAETPDIAGKAR
jgi:hypothetical protein